MAHLPHSPMAGQADGCKAKPSDPNGAFFRKAPLLRKLCGKLPPLSVGGGGKLFAKASLLRKRSTLVRAKRSAEMRTLPTAQPRTPEAPTCEQGQSAPRSYYHCDHTKLRGDAAALGAEVRLGGVAETCRERRFLVLWYWIRAPLKIPELGIEQGDILLVDLDTGEILGLERRY